MKKFFLSLVTVMMFGATTMSAQSRYTVVHASDYVNGTGNDRIEMRNDDAPRTFNVAAYVRNQQIAPRNEVRCNEVRYDEVRHYAPAPARRHAPARVRDTRVVVVESAPVVYHHPAPMPPAPAVVVASPRPEAIVGAAIGTVVGAAITSLILR